MKFLFSYLAKFIKTMPIGTIVYLSMVLLHGIDFSPAFLVIIMIIDAIDSWIQL